MGSKIFSHEGGVKKEGTKVFMKVPLKMAEKREC